MVHDSGRTVTVRARASAGMTRPSTWKRRRKLRKIFSAYTQASKFPASLPKNPARVPTADKNSHGRAVRVSSREFDFWSATIGAAARKRMRRRTAALRWRLRDPKAIRGHDQFKFVRWCTLAFDACKVSMLLTIK